MTRTWRTLLLGAATGGRGSIALAGPTLTDPRASGLRRALAVAALGGELVGDLLPTTPARTQPGPLLGRALAGAGAGVVLARRDGGPVPRAALAGAAAAVAGAVVGVAWRRWAGAHAPDVVGALAEDVLVLSAAAVACRPAGRAAHHELRRR